MMRLLKNLMSYITILSLIACSTHQLKNDIILPTNIFKPIDSAQPPKDGVWASYQDASEFVNQIKIKEISLKEKLVITERDRDLALTKLEGKTQELLEQEKNQNWFSRWGMPIGLMAGVGISLAVFFAVK